MSCWSFKPGDRPDFVRLLNTFEKLPKKRLVRSPSHPIQLSRSAESVFWVTQSRARTGSVGGDQPLLYNSKLWDNGPQQEMDLKGNYSLNNWPGRSVNLSIFLQFFCLCLSFKKKLVLFFVVVFLANLPSYLVTFTIVMVSVFPPIDTWLDFNK